MEIVILYIYALIRLAIKIRITKIIVGILIGNLKMGLAVAVGLKMTPLTVLICQIKLIYR
jgi:hypothetical protein